MSSLLAKERERVTGKGKETIIFSRRRWWVCVHMSTVVRKEENLWPAVESTLRLMGPVRLGLGMLVNSTSYYSLCRKI
jgi:hypothetical protein